MTDSDLARSDGPRRRSTPRGTHLALTEIGGVPIDISWSVIVIAWLIGAGLANSTLPDMYPGYREVEYAAAAMVAVIGFLASVLGHELAHVFVAQRYGVAVDGVRLWLIGGITTFSNEPPHPKADVHIAAAGPTSSILIGLSWFGVGGALAETAAPELVVGTALWLGTVNLVLAGFNLIPAFPLDGGRIARGGLWRWRDDRVWATKRAATGGRAFAVVLVGVGVLLATGGSWVSAAWLWLIALFLTAAAVSETRAVTTSWAFGALTCGDVMTVSPVCIDGSLSVSEAVDDVVMQRRWSAYPVVDDEHRFVGLLTLNRIRRVAPDDRATTSVASAAYGLGDVVAVWPGTSAIDAIRELERSDARRVVVVDDGRPIGIISHSDVVRGLDLAQLIRNP